MLQASWKRKEIKRLNEDMIELRKERIDGRARDCVRRSLAKVLFAVGGNKL